ncbi:MAG: ankyrin repeat protein [Myxococcota bacterium]|jgi:ankyrin repeat protein
MKTLADQLAEFFGDRQKLEEKLLDGTIPLELKMGGDGISILQAAILNDDPFIISFLLEKYPQLIDSVDKNGKTAMHYASMTRDVELLLQHNPQIINQTDNFDNSPLYYCAFGVEPIDKMFFSKLFDLGGKYIKSGIETRTSLHLRIALNEIFTVEQKDIGQINVQDEYGKTALHYAIELQKDGVIDLLKQEKIDVNLPDNFGRTAFHCMLMYGFGDIEYHVGKENLITEDNDGVSLLAMACYGKSKKNYQLIKESAHYHRSQLDDRIAEAVENFDYKNIAHYVRNLDQNQTLIILSCVSSLSPEKRPFIDSYAKEYLSLDLDSKNKEFEKGEVFGFEVELAHIPQFSLIPTEFLINWFCVQSHIDNTVKPSIFMNNESFGIYPEMVSEPVKDSRGMDNYLRFCQILKNSGALVNGTAGFHVHRNINGGSDFGSIADQVVLNDHIKEEVELEIFKQMIVNFAIIEPLLNGFMRWGEGFSPKSTFYDPSAAASILPFVEELKKLTSFSDISSVQRSRKYSINSLSIKSSKNTTQKEQYGTMEFRLHEGAIEPTIIKAWASLIRRISNISVYQVQEKINANSFQNVPIDRSDITPYEGLENLVYLLIAEREYQKSWDNDLGRVATAFVNPSLNQGKTTQKEIQESPLYNMYQTAKKGGDIVECHKKYVENASDKIQIMKDLNSLLEFDDNWTSMSKNPVRGDILQFIKSKTERKGPSKKFSPNKTSKMMSFSSLVLQ